MPENNPINPMSTLNGGENFTVTKRDGTTETVFVKQVPVSQFPQYLKALDEETQMIAIACGKDVAFSDALAPESFEQLIEKIEGINNDFFQRWFQRKAKRMEILLGGVGERVKAALPITLPKPPSSAA